jgi:hypothetical protein
LIRAVVIKFSPNARELSRQTAISLPASTGVTLNLDRSGAETTTMCGQALRLVMQKR